MGYLPALGLIALFMGMIYLLMIRPIRQREKRHDALIYDLEIGDMVITAGGMYGKIESIEEDSVILSVESGARIRVTKGGILKRDEGLDISELLG